MVVTFNQKHIQQWIPEDTNISTILLLVVMVISAILVMWDSREHTEQKNKALKKAREIIAIVHLDPIFQINRVGKLLELTGLPKSSTPILTHSFTGLKASVTETEFIAIAPLLEPLRNRFQ